jgi:LuxR family maltose regulon positive regulatory protein
LSLNGDDGDITSFLTYLIAALQTIYPHIGQALNKQLQSPQLPPTETLLAVLINDLTAIPEALTLVLDDYHLLDSRAVDVALTYLIEHLPGRMHLIITTREDPHLPLARLRMRGELNELRAADLRFTTEEITTFLKTMGLNLSTEVITLLDARTEGWIAGLQLAALSMQGVQDKADFIA